MDYLKTLIRRLLIVIDLVLAICLLNLKKLGELALFVLQEARILLPVRYFTILSTYRK